MSENPVPPLVIMTQAVRVRRIKSGSLFKLIFTGFAAIFLPIFLLCGIAAFFGKSTITVQQQHVTGIMGLVDAIIMAPFLIFFFTVFTWVFLYLGIRISGYFKPLVIEYVPSDKPQA